MYRDGDVYMTRLIQCFRRILPVHFWCTFLVRDSIFLSGSHKYVWYLFVKASTYLRTDVLLVSVNRLDGEYDFYENEYVEAVSFSFSLTDWNGLNASTVIRYASNLKMIESK